MVKFFVHPKYDGTPTCGYDYAIAIVDLGSEQKKNWNKDHYYPNAVENTLCMRYDVEIAKKAIGSELAITGYPGEKEKRGYMFKGVGKLMDVWETPAGGLVAGYNSYTTPGVSGAHITITSQYMLQLAIDWFKKRAEEGDEGSKYVVS